MNNPAPEAHEILAAVPDGLRTPLIDTFNRVIENFRAGRWEPSELNGGKLCEIVYSIIDGYVFGKYPATPKKPRKFIDACRALENADGSHPVSVRIQIPRLLVALYDIRNHRGVAHVGGEVDPNGMDAAAVVALSKWLMAELIRIFHGIDVTAAQAVVDAIIAREVPLVWEVNNGVKRVLDARLTHKPATLLLLYDALGPVFERDLQAWVEHPRLSDYRKDVLRPLHKTRLIEYDAVRGTAQLSPLGANHVEMTLLPPSAWSAPFERKAS